MSAFHRFADFSRTARQGREVPEADSGARALLIRPAWLPRISARTFFAKSRRNRPGMTLMQSADEMVPASVTWRVTAWANVSRTGAANRPHCHPAAFWSGVYWVADGGVADNPAVGGLFEIADPRGVLPLMHAPHLRVAIKDCH